MANCEVFLDGCVHCWRGRAEQAERALVETGAGFIELVCERDALRTQLHAAQEALEWYGEKARAAKRYLEAKPPKAAALTALITELALDDGGRAALSPRPTA